MAKRTKGKCKYCGKEYTFSYMNRHLGSCAERKKKQEEEGKGRQCGYFELAVYSRYLRDYWLFIEVRETATLKDVDSFLRDIWLECCGHLSSFDIGGVKYDVMPYEDFAFDEPSKSMDYKLKSVLLQGMTIDYEYDFGSTTELTLSVTGYRVGRWKREKITILSRNDPPTLLCDECGKETATAVCVECAWDNHGLLCTKCAKTHPCGEEMLLAVCNSPRMGVCAYEGSSVYPEQFVPDV